MSRCLLLVLYFAAMPMAIAVVNVNDYAYAAALNIDAQSALNQAVLPLDVYRHTVRADLGDLCVVNGRAEVVPFALRRPTTLLAAPPVVARLPVFPLKESDSAPSAALRLRLRAAGTSLEIEQPPVATTAFVAGAYLIDARGSDRPLVALRLQWSDDTPDFSARLIVESSSDLVQWQTIATDAPVVNLHVSGEQFIRAEVALPRVTAPYLRLRWADKSPQVKFSGVSGVRSAAQIEVARMPVSVAGSATEVAGEYDFDLGARLPLDQVNVRLPEPNTVIDAEFLVRDSTSTAWRPIARGRLYRLRVAHIGDLSNAPLAIALTSARYWRVRVANTGGGVGSGVPALVGGWLPDELVFLTRGSPPFRLLYGNVAATPQAIGLSSLLAANGQLRSSGDQFLSAARISVGPPTLLGGAQRLIPPKPELKWKRLILWTVLVLGVLLLGSMAWKLSREL